MLNSLDIHQQQVLKNNNILVVAGAGTGKTHTTISYTKWLKQEKLATDYSILYLSFTNKAAKEGANRAKKYGVNIIASTIHGFAYRYLKKNNIVKSKVLNNDILKQACNDLDVIIRERDIEKYQLDDSCFNNEEKNILNKVINYIHDHGYITFADMLIKYNDILLQIRNNKLDFNNKFTHICVDEAQDLSPIQYEIIRNMALITKSKILMVGDFRQSIYGFRSSDPKLMHRFVKDFNPDIVNLKQTYRCGNNITKISNIIAKGMDFHSDMFPSSKVDKVRYMFSNNIKILYDLRMREPKNETIAYLTRTNFELAIVGSALRKMKVPVVFYADTNIATTAYGRALRALIYGILYPSDKLATATMLDRIKVGIGPKTLKKYETICDIVTYKKLNKKQELFFDSYEQFMDLPLHESNMMSLIEIFDPYLKDNLNRKRWVLEEFGALNIDEFKDYIESMENTEEVDEEKISKYPIRLSTIHSSKGLEFDHVLLGLEWYVNKYEKTYPDKTDEERRILYVGTTRAKKTLNISSHNHQAKWYKGLLSHIIKEK